MYNDFKEMENRIWESNDARDLIDESNEYGSDKQFRSYVEQIVQCYVQEMITIDIITSGFDERLINLVRDIDVSIPDELCDFYKGKTYYKEALEALERCDNEPFEHPFLLY